VIDGSLQEAGETVRQDEADNIGWRPFDGTRETSEQVIDGSPQEAGETVRQEDKVT
jgi:hypothetical protein